MRSLPTLLLPALLLAGGCAPRPTLAGPAPVPSWPLDACRDADDFRACAARTEAAVLAASGGRVTRRGDTLRIRTDRDGPVTLVSDTTEGDPFVLFHYEGYLDEVRQHLVAAWFYEGGGYLLVDGGRGSVVHLAGRPVLSPRRTRFAVASVDLWAQYDPNLLQLWRLGDEGPVLELGLDGGDTWGASGPAWLSETELEFTRHERAEDGEGERTSRMRLRLTAGGMELLPARP
jgi:hypothetical protein